MKYGLFKGLGRLNSPYFTATDGGIRKIDQKRGPAMMADHKSVTRMLKTARGQIDGILRMVDEDRYCVDISTQLMATQALIARINADVLKAHIEGCVASAIESGDEELKAAKLAEIERVVDKLAK